MGHRHFVHPLVVRALPLKLVVDQTQNHHTRPQHGVHVPGVPEIGLIEVQCEGVRSQGVTFHFLVYIFRATH